MTNELQADQAAAQRLLAPQMDDGEAVEVMIRTEPEHLSNNERDEPVQAALPEGVTVEPTQGTYPRMFHALSQIDDGLVIAWDVCARCSKMVSRCSCAQGPQEPGHIARWRSEYLAKREAAFAAESAAQDEQAAPAQDS